MGEKIITANIISQNYYDIVVFHRFLFFLIKLSKKFFIF
nr:MAG TPA: hypothetical protein [Caudoviricetes sp.]